MKITDKQYAILLNAIAVVVEVAHIKDAQHPTVQDLTTIREAQAYCTQHLSPEVGGTTFGELDELFSTLTELAIIHNMEDQDKALASLEPTSKYLH